MAADDAAKAGFRTAAAPQDWVRLSVDGRELAVPPGTSILEAARRAGVDIPTLCYHPELTVAGACRLCLVEVEGARNLAAACATPVQQDMVVHTESPQVVEARRTVLELLLQNHPLECYRCERNGDCRLQDYAYRYQVEAPQRPGAVRHFAPDDSNPFFVRDYDKCILCGQCVRVCDEIQAIGAIDYTRRGFNTQITSAYGQGLEEAGCVFCGMCVDVCPVGALVPKYALGAGRSWEKTWKRTICPYCGVGCAIELAVKGGRIVGARAAPDSPANAGKICVKGHFGWNFVQSPDRLTTPLVRRGGKDSPLEPASWDEALDRVARGLAEIREQYGPDALAVLSSAKCTNEENYLMQKLARAVLGTNNVDHCARLCHASTVAGLAMAFGSGAMTNSIGDLAQAQVLLVIGSNTTEAHPVIGLRIKEAVRRGAKLIVADPRRIPLTRYADLHLQLLPGTNVALLNGLAWIIWKRGWYDAEFVAARTEGFEGWSRAVEPYNPEYVSKLTGVPVQALEEAARLYAQAERAAIVYSMGVTQHTSGTDGVLAVANLAMLTGNLGRPGTGVNPLRGQNNVQGACDMGALPDVLPGYQKIEDPAVREKFGRAWGVRLPERPGLTVTEIMDAAARGQIRGLYLMGENPVLSDPDAGHVQQALQRLDFLVVQDIFLTESAALADVVLPGTTFAEKEGTFTNTERRVQEFTPVIEPVGAARPDWQILLDVAERLGHRWDTRTPAAILDEAASLTPIYGGIRHRRLGPAGLQWPCPTPDHPGTPILHTQQFSRGKGLFHPVTYRRAHELPDEEYPFILSTGRLLFHFHTGTMSRRSPELTTHRPWERSEINRQDAARLGLKDGDVARIRSRRGSVLTRVEVTDRVPPGVVFMTFHYRESAANLLTAAALDPVARIPEFKVSAVQVEKVAPEQAPAVPEEYARCMRPEARV